MYITVDILQKRNVDSDFVDYVKSKYPDGVEAMVLIKEEVPMEFLHECYKWLDLSKEEITAYWNRICVVNSEGIDESDHVSNSRLIVDSSDILDSESVINSKQVTNSKYISSSMYVDNSQFISFSAFVDNSQKILRGKNVTDSTEVVDSVYVVNSHGVFGSNNISDSRFVHHSNNLTNCAFCFNCNNLNNSLFCFNSEDNEYLLFNKKIDQSRFDMIYKQFKRYATPCAEMTENWSTNIHSATPTKIYNYRKHIEKMPDTFWAWVQTLPGYDPSILYSLTFNPRFLV